MILEEYNHGFVQFQGPFIPESAEDLTSMIIFEGNNDIFLKRLHIQYLDGVYAEGVEDSQLNLGKIKFELGQKNKYEPISFYFGRKDEVLLEDVAITSITISTVEESLEDITQTILIDAILVEEKEEKINGGFR